jgi:hypothetical protein
MTMSEDRSLDQVTSLTPEVIQLGVDGGTTLYAGSFAAPLTATGMLAVGGGVSSTNAVMGISAAQADNSAGADGALSVNLLQGVFRRVNSATSPCVAATAGKVVYAEDGETVRIASGATYPVAGVFIGFEADGTTPLVFCSAVLNYLLSQGTLSSNLAAITTGLGASLIGVEDSATNFAGANVEAVLAEIIATYAAITNGNGASMIGVEDAATNFAGANVEAVLAEIIADYAAVTNGNGASKIGVEDSGTFTTAADVEACLAEIYQGLITATATLAIESGAGCMIAAGTPLAAFADNAASNPGVTLADSKAMAIRWNNNGTQAAVWTKFVMPADMDITEDAVLHFLVSKSGATNDAGNTTTIDAALYNQVGAALHDAETDFGGTSSALVPDATAKTISNLTLTLTAADLAAGAGVSMSFKPTDGTLDTDDLMMHAIYMTYTKKIPTS